LLKAIHQAPLIRAKLLKYCNEGKLGLVLKNNTS